MAMLLKNCVKEYISNYNIVRPLSTLSNGSSSYQKVNQSAAGLHVTSQHQYPQMQPMPLPNNVNDDTAHFSPQRARDLNGPAIMSHQSVDFAQNTNCIDVTAEVDSHTQCYDCNGAVSLNSSMQSNVPSPFSDTGSHYMHLNMPGGHWEQWSKYVSNDLQCSHYTNLRQQIRSSDNNKQGISIHKARKSIWDTLILERRYLHTMNKSNKSTCMSVIRKHFSNDVEKEKNDPPNKRQIMKRAIKDYGATVVLFHISHSLMTLGLFYLLLSSGLDVTALLAKMGFSQHIEKIAGAGTFVAAYAINKILAPVRISFTLACTPFIVKYLRKVGFLKSSTNTRDTS